MPELRDALREATNKLGVLAGNPQLIAFDAMLTSYPALTMAGPIGFGVNPANAFAGAAATIEVIANGANVPTFTGITATGSWVNTAGAVNRIEFECLPSGPGSALAFYAQIGKGGGAAPVTSVAGKTGAVTLVKGDVGLASVDNTADADKPVSSAVASAISGRQPLNPNLTVIGSLTNGIPEITGVGAVTSIVPGATGRLSMAAGTETAGRAAIGLGALATESVTPTALFGITDWAVPAAASADLMCDRLFGSVPIVTTAGTIQHYPPANLFFNEESYTQFASDVVFEVPVNGDATYSNGYFLIHGYANPGFVPRPDSVKIDLFRSDTATWANIIPETPWPVDSRNLLILQSNGSLLYTAKARITVKGTNFLLTKLRWIVTRSNTNPAVYKDDTRTQTLKGALRLPSLQFNGGATQTASLRGSKTIGTPSATDTITVVGAAAGDIVGVSRGKDAFVSAANTVQFDSTGLGGVVVSAIVERFV